MRRRCSARLSSMRPSSKSSSFWEAAVPASIFIARCTSSDAVSRSTLPISLRYMRTGSPVSITVVVSERRARAREERFGLETFALETERRASLTSRASFTASKSSSSSSSKSDESSKSSSDEKSSSTASSSMAKETVASDAVVISTPLTRSESYRSESSSSLTSTSRMAT